MSQPNRLFESSESEVERLLLRAGREVAPPGAKHRALLAATGALAATSLTASAAGGGVLGGNAAASVKAASLLSLKWMAVASVATVSMAVGTVAVHHAVTPRHAAVAPSSVAAPHASRKGSSVATSSLATKSDPSPELPVVSVAPEATVARPEVPRVVHAPALAPAAAPTTDTVSAASGPANNTAAEVALVDQASGALASGDPARALSILDGYVTRFPHGTMAPEAAIVRIEALMKAGDADAAKRAADAFLTANPRSPYAARIESILGATNR